MAMTPNARAEWVLAQLEGNGSSEDLAPPGDTELDRAEMAREAAECRETWQALGKLDDRIASETPSLQIRSAFQEQLADVVQRERARRVDWFPFGWIFARAPGIRAGALAAAILVTIAALALWRPVVRSLRESAGKE
jgi:hypothetical protein